MKILFRFHPNSCRRGVPLPALSMKTRKFVSKTCLLCAFALQRPFGIYCRKLGIYREASNIRRTLVGNKKLITQM